MKSLSTYLQKIIQGLRFRENRKLYLFLTCIALSAGFWLLNALTKSYDVSVSIPVAYANLPNDVVIVNQLPEALTCNVNGEGFSLIGADPMEDGDSFRVDLSSVQWTGSMSRFKTAFPTRGVVRVVQEAFGTDVRILRMSQDSIGIIAERLDKRTLAVQPIIQPQFSEEYTYKVSPSWNPTSLEVTGPTSVLSGRDTLYTIPIAIDSLEGPQQVEVVLDKPHASVRMETHAVSLSYELERVTQKVVSVPIRLVNVPKHLQVQVYPRDVQVTLTCGLSKFESLGATSVVAKVDCSQVEKRPARLSVRVSSRKPGVDVRLIDPQRVEYILRTIAP